MIIILLFRNMEINIKFLQKLKIVVSEKSAMK
jgi:hypothetical protein